MAGFTYQLTPHSCLDTAGGNSHHRHSDENIHKHLKSFKIKFSFLTLLILKNISNSSALNPDLLNPQHFGFMDPIQGANVNRNMLKKRFALKKIFTNERLINTS